MTRAAIILICVASISCKKDAESDKSQEQTDETERQTDKPPADAAPRMVTRTFELERSGREATVLVDVPSSWVEDRGSYRQPDPFDGVWPSRVKTEIGGWSCKGSCTPADYKRERDAVIERQRDHLAKPNVRTGKPELDAVRLEVTEIAEGELDGGGRFAAHRVRKPEGVDGPYFEGSRATCARYREGDDFYIVTEVSANLGAEDEWFDDLLAACKAARVK